ncbi:hypothetical protein ACP70R_019055 [Stipagrostis hirtigluma subsp. patula]
MGDAPMHDSRMGRDLRFEGGGIINEVVPAARWVLATGAPHHATGNRALLSGSITDHDAEFIYGTHGVNRQRMQVVARGDVLTENVALSDVWHVPGLMKNIVSITQLTDQGYKVGIGRFQCSIRRRTDNQVVGKGHLLEPGCYVLDVLQLAGVLDD